MRSPSPPRGTPATYRSTGSSSPTLPSSTSCMTTVATKVLVALPIRKYPPTDASPAASARVPEESSTDSRAPDAHPCSTHPSRAGNVPARVSTTPAIAVLIIMRPTLAGATASGDEDDHPIDCGEPQHEARVGAVGRAPWQDQGVSDIQRVGVVGAGLMGSGIAEVCARAGLDVLVAEVSPDATVAARGRIAAPLGKGVRSRKLSAEHRDAALERLRFTTDLADFTDRNLVVEAAAEIEQVKTEVFT